MLKKTVKNIFKSFNIEVKRINSNYVVPNPYYKGIVDNLEYYETPIGNYFLPTDVSLDIIKENMQWGNVFEPPVIEVAKKYIKKGSTVLDVGTNFGQMSIIFSKLAGDTGKVYSFDADDFVFEILKKNLKANNCTNAEPIYGAVYNKDNEILIFPKQDFQRFKAYGSYGIDPNAKEGREVKSHTIDSLNIQTPISFMKVDVQGSDLFALQGAVKTIEKHKMPILFEFEQQFQDEFKTSFQDYVDFTRSINYSFKEIIMGINYLIVPN